MAAKPMQTHEGWPDYRCRHGAPRAARIVFGDGQTAYFVAGTDYGFLHTTSGDLRTWRTAGSARRAAKAYRDARK